MCSFFRQNAAQNNFRTTGAIKPKLKKQPNGLTTCQRAPCMFPNISSESTASSLINHKLEEKKLQAAHSLLRSARPFPPFSPTLSPTPSLSLPLSLRNDTHANSGYPCHLPLTSCGSRDHVFSVPWDLHSAPIIWQLL